MQLLTTLEEWNERRKHPITDYPGVSLFTFMLDVLHTCDKGFANAPNLARRASNIWAHVSNISPASRPGGLPPYADAFYAMLMDKRL